MRGEVRAAENGRAQVFVTEGEKDAEAVYRLGIAATTNPGGVGGGWQESYTDDFEEISRVVVVADKDTNQKGYRHAQKVAASLRRVVPDVVILEAAVGKDVATTWLPGWGSTSSCRCPMMTTTRRIANHPPTTREPASTGSTSARTSTARWSGSLPTCLTMTDGRSLLHRARLNGVHGDSGAGKSWLMAFLLREQIEAGHVVMLIDLEDTPARRSSGCARSGSTYEAIRSQTRVRSGPDEAFAVPTSSG